MKKLLVLFVLTFALGLFLIETAHAQPPIKTVTVKKSSNTPIPKNKLLEEVAYENSNFVYLPSKKDASPDGMYASYQKIDQVFENHAMAHQWVRIINGTLTAIRLEIGFDQNVISVWKKDTDPDSLGQLPDYQIPAAKKIWDVQTLETNFAFVIFYKTLNDGGDVEIVEVDIP